ncbi:MAG: four-carbon acid sugar kinase family protein [Bryobacteraceae bacterium]
MCILALADDMTGALEVGAKFSAAGIDTLVSTQPVAANSAHAVVLDTETRHLSPDAAAAEIKRFVLPWYANPPRLIYKKTDSTLRGNIASELQALAELYPEWRIGYAPAYPALGRTVKSGVLFVDGVAVEQTAFARDARNPVRTGSIAAMLHPELPCTVFDGETGEHLQDAARSIIESNSMRIAAGPAGLGEMIAALIHLPRGIAPPLPAIRRCLVLNGSLHERSELQMRNADAARWLLLRREYPPGSDPARVAKENGGYLVSRIAADDPDAIFVIGGDSAFAVIEALGTPPLLPIRELLPGVPVTRITSASLRDVLPARSRDLLLITKAGGFGHPDVFSRIRQQLDSNAQ